MSGYWKNTGDVFSKSAFGVRWSPCPGASASRQSRDNAIKEPLLVFLGLCSRPQETSCLPAAIGRLLGGLRGERVAEGRATYLPASERSLHTQVWSFEFSSASDVAAAALRRFYPPKEHSVSAREERKREILHHYNYLSKNKHTYGVTFS